MIGRPTDYTLEKADEIVRRLSEGEPLAVICRDEHLPHRSTVYEWQKVDAEFTRRIARARDEGFDAIASDCLMIADGRDVLERADLDAQVANDVTVVRDHNRDRLRVDTRLKLLAKWDPKRYGDKVALVGGGEDDPAIKTIQRIERVIVRPTSSDA